MAFVDSANIDRQDLFYNSSQRSTLFRMGEGIAGLPPISCHTMIKRSVDRHTGSTAIVDRHRHQHTAILPPCFNLETA